jgi:PBP1b-binding outer membrane lipoprotein LpoB
MKTNQVVRLSFILIIAFLFVGCGSQRATTGQTTGQTASQVTSQAEQPVAPENNPTCAIKI